MRHRGRFEACTSVSRPRSLPFEAIGGHRDLFDNALRMSAQGRLEPSRDDSRALSTFAEMQCASSRSNLRITGPSWDARRQAVEAAGSRMGASPVPNWSAAR
eukprot:5869580-Pyramimonas_sp.AAC.1